jgi:hypothetical protein
MKTASKVRDPNSVQHSATLVAGGNKSAGSIYESIGKDVYFYVSGSHDVNSLAERRVAVFGGDVVISGSLTVEGGELAGSFAFDADILELTGSIQVDGSGHFTGGISGSLTRLADGSPYLVSGPGVSITTGSTGQITISTSVIEWNEALGVGDGTNRFFNLAYEPINSRALMVFVDGVLQEEDNGTSDFSLSGSTIEFTFPPDINCKIKATYSRR